MYREALSHVLIAYAHGQTLYKLRERQIIVLISINIDHVFTWHPPLSSMVYLWDNSLKDLPDLLLDLLNVVLLGLCKFIRSNRFLCAILLLTRCLWVWFFISLFF